LEAIKDGWVSNNQPCIKESRARRGIEGCGIVDKPKRIAEPHSVLGFELVKELSVKQPDELVQNRVGVVHGDDREINIGIGRKLTPAIASSGHDGGVEIGLNLPGNGAKDLADDFIGQIALPNMPSNVGGQKHLT
jgi:hypothetical protein